MPARCDRMRLGAFLYPGGHHVAAWRHPSAEADAGVNAAHYRRIARTAEAAKFDLIYLADGVAVRVEDIDALTLLSHLAAVTERIGLVATASATAIRVPTAP